MAQLAPSLLCSCIFPSRRLCSSAQSTHTRKQNGGAHEEEKEEKEKNSLIKEQRLVHEQITFINSRPSTLTVSPWDSQFRESSHTLTV